MSDFNQMELEQVIIEIMATATGKDAAALSMDTTLEEINLQSMQLISVAALLEDKLDYGPNFRTLMGMGKISEIRDYYLK